MTDHCDVTVIGPGLGGTAPTHARASAGQRVLVLERASSPMPGAPVATVGASSHPDTAVPA
jgi:flavin-dependent dehydrogenase